MRVLSVLAWVALVASTATRSTKADISAIKANVNHTPRELASEHSQVKRSLRYLPSHSNYEDTEDRTIGDKVDDVVMKLDDVTGLNKLDDATGKAKKLVPKLDDALMKNLDGFQTYVTRSALVNQLKGKYKYADELDLSTLKQLSVIEARRPEDIKNFHFSKATGSSLHKHVDDFEGIKRAPKQYMESHVGREAQRYGPNNERMISAGVISRPESQGGGDVLLISGSKPTKGDWLLPKGGWDKGEDVKMSAMREMIEEGGVNTKLLHSLGKRKVSDRDNEYIIYPFMAKSITVYDDYAENVRYRIWVPYNDAIKLLSKRPYLAKLVQQAKKKAKQIAAGKLPEQDKKMRKFLLDVTE
ncbi:hypothetical protein PHMEG_00023796 [Phytophthora megakarya]|uniref:Nudix hydrolase domain-containing protein n=1 Tax=Phytophthora megakarya TaxID=4795 RepID=A0A225VIH3_9STRA|nr:hypothetical protein PHMEG_00023796 [Phytophthora megakarya]